MKIMTKKVDKLTTDELEAELKKRKAAEAKLTAAQKKAEAKAAKEEEDRLYKEIYGALEAAFEKAQQECAAELKEAQELAAKADALAISIAEKYGLPIEWGHGTYVPHTAEKWSTKDLSEDQQEFVDEHLIEIAYFDGETSFGEWWYPSRNC